jgi:geranylgeranyl diphosphate synthase type I
MSAPAPLDLPSLYQALEADLQGDVHLLASEGTGEMAEMIAYHLGWTEPQAASGGKRIRPLLTLLCCAAAGGDWHLALPVASSVELIHNFSLLHDDIQDNSAERRGRPTVWKRWGVPQAINTGDALLILAHLAGLRLTSLGVDPRVTLDVVHLLDDACLSLTRGQHLDLAFEARAQVSEAEYLEMIGGKTAALVAAATSSGARLAQAPFEVVDGFRLYGRHLGMAFQILDDILGTWGAPEVTGKPAGDDLRARKKSLPVLFGIQHSPSFVGLWTSDRDDDSAIAAMATALEETGALEYARREAEEHTDLALQSLEGAASPGPAREALIQLTHRLLRRDS